MMKKMVTAIVITGIILSVGVTALTGCGAKKTKLSEDGVITVRVGTGNAYEPYCYLDSNGNLAGYEYEVLKAVDKLLPKYKFEYQTSDFANVLISLDAGKIDLAAHQYEWNEERDKKYLFGKESYTTYVTYIVVSNDRNDIKSLDDLQGLTVKSSTGSNSTYILETYNEQHSANPVKIDYVDNSTEEETVAGLTSGVWDATILTKREVDKYNKAYGKGKDLLKIAGDPVQTSSTYFIFDKKNTKLQEAVDGALKDLKKSGKLAEISIDAIGGDYTESE